MKSKKTNILLSVFPEYVDRIISGEKRFEFRKHIPTKRVEHIVFYATAPTARILCIAKIDSIISGSPEYIWETTALFSGVDKIFYDRYYKNADLAYAYKLGSIYTLKKPLSLLDKNIRTSPPQTFRYLTREQFDYIKKNKVLVSSGFRRTIFLAGIHAVGKTTFAKEKFSSKYEVVTASLLIKNGSGDVPLNKKVHNINKNQLILIYEFNKLKKLKKNIVLDGHFCLLDKSGNITYIPVTVFKKLGISHIILLETHPKIIQQRLLERDKTRMSLEKIIKLLEAERKHALYIAHKLKIPITIVPDTRLTEHAILDI